MFKSIGQVETIEISVKLLQWCKMFTSTVNLFLGGVGPEFYSPKEDSGRFWHMTEAHA